MKIDRINLKEFGKYSGGSNILDFDDGVYLIIGKNESGTSTLFNGILTMLYGFKPADRRKNIFSNWSTETIDIEGNVVFDKTNYEISRRLLSGPKGHISYENKKVDIGNSPLFFLDGIGRETFKSIYFLTAYDMAKIQDCNWNEIEDRLIMNSGISSLNLTRDVLSDLNDEIRELYKNRGNSQIKMKKNEILSLKRKRKDLIFEFEIFKEKSLEMEKIDKSILSVDHDISETAVKLKTIIKFQPLAQTINNLSNLKLKIKSFEGNFGSDEEEINKNLKECKKYVKEIEESGNKDDELRSRKEKFFTKYQEIFCESVDEESVEKIKKINFTNLQVILKKINDLREEISKIRERKHGISLKNIVLRFILGIIIFLFGAGIFTLKNSIAYEIPYKLEFFLMGAGAFLLLDNLVFIIRNRKKSLENAIEIKKNEINELMKILKDEISEYVNEQLIISSPMGFLAEVEQLRDISLRVPVKGNAVFDIFSSIGDGNHKKGIELFNEYLKNIQRINFISEELEKLDPSYELRNCQNLISEESFSQILNADIDEIKTELDLKKNILK